MRICSAPPHLPLIVVPDGDGFSERLAWIERNTSLLTQRLHEHGAIRFEALGADTVEAFERLTTVFFARPMSYVAGDAQRTRVSGGTYTSSELPAEMPIPLHNELSYSSNWPEQLLFGCLVAPESGGETPIGDCRGLLRTLDASLVDEFARRGVRYVRNLHGGNGFGRSWQQTFETHDAAAVDAICAEMQIDLTWKPDGGARLVQSRPAIATHPQTGERVWFNQAEQYHPSAMPQGLYEAMMRIYGDDPEALPRYATFGDGEAIADDALAAIRHAIQGTAVSLPWERGAALWIDNMLVSHGRAPYRGARRIVVAMA